MVGLGEGARYLVEYPYGCAEQRGSRALALLLAADLGDAFTLPGIDTAKMRPAVAADAEGAREVPVRERRLRLLARRSAASVSPYLTAYLLHVFKTAADLKYDVDAGDARRGPTPISRRELAQKPPANEGWWPAYTAWQAFAVKVLVEGGRNQDSNLTRLYGYRDRMPVFALAYLHDALIARGRERTRRPRLDGAAAADDQRHPARGGQRARRGAERSVPALVLELERALDGDRAEHAGAGRRATQPRSRRWCAG